LNEIAPPVNFAVRQFCLMKFFTLFFVFVTVLFPDFRIPQEQGPQGTPVAFSQLGPRRPGPRTSYILISGISDRRRMVIRDRETWRDVWKQIHSGAVSFSIPGPGREPVLNLSPLPEIDFSGNMVLVVTMGSQPNGGYWIVVDGVYEHGNELEVVVRNVSPRNCFTAQIVTQAADIVQLPKREGSVVFRDVNSVTDCSQTRPAP
jgi:hypothetical protein